MSELLKITFDKSTYESAKSHVDFITEHDEYLGFCHAEVMMSFAVHTFYELCEVAYPNLDLQKQLLAFISKKAIQMSEGMVLQTYPYSLSDDTELTHSLCLDDLVHES